MLALLGSAMAASGLPPQEIIQGQISFFYPPTVPGDDHFLQIKEPLLLIKTTDGKTYLLESNDQIDPMIYKKLLNSNALDVALEGDIIANVANVKDFLAFAPSDLSGVFVASKLLSQSSNTLQRDLKKFQKVWKNALPDQASDEKLISFQQNPSLGVRHLTVMGTNALVGNDLDFSSLEIKDYGNPATRASKSRSTIRKSYDAKFGFYTEITKELFVEPYQRQPQEPTNKKTNAIQIKRLVLRIVDNDPETLHWLEEVETSAEIAHKSPGLVVFSQDPASKCKSLLKTQKFIRTSSLKFFTAVGNRAKEIF